MVTPDNATQPASASVVDRMDMKRKKVCVYECVCVCLSVCQLFCMAMMAKGQNG